MVVGKPLPHILRKYARKKEKRKKKQIEHEVQATKMKVPLL